MLKVSHIAVAVNNLDESVQKLANLLNLPTDSFKRRRAEEEGVLIAEKSFNGVELELIEPIDSSSPIYSFLERRGEGLHHICFEVDDIKGEFERLKAMGVRLLSEDVNKISDYYYFFIHPKEASGILIEFKQLNKEKEYG